MKTSTKKVSKLVIEITTRELFYNYAHSSLDVAWDSSHHSLDDNLKDPLETIHIEGEGGITQLFRNAMTPMLLGAAFNDTRMDNYEVVEIVVTKRNGTTFVVAHEDIQY